MTATSPVKRVSHGIRQPPTFSPLPDPPPRALTPAERTAWTRWIDTAEAVAEGLIDMTVEVFIGIRQQHCRLLKAGFTFDPRFNAEFAKAAVDLDAALRPFDPEDDPDDDHDDDDDHSGQPVNGWPLAWIENGDPR